MALVKSEAHITHGKKRKEKTTPLGWPGTSHMHHMDAVQARYECNVQVKPSVLHGDLWSGNISGVDGEPSIFDPAVYYGHSEADFGMSWCAGFSSAFYDAYHRVLPKAPGQSLVCCRRNRFMSMATMMGAS